MTNKSSTCPETRLGRIRRQWRGDQRGLAAVEFALILPLMLLLYFGSIEMTQGFNASRKLTLLARSLADLTAQAASTQDDSAINAILSAATGVFYPFSNPAMVISSVKFQTLASDGKVHGYVAWTFAAGGGAARSCGEVVRRSASSAPTAIDDGFFANSTSIIVADVNYTYRPLAGSRFMSIGNNSYAVGTGSIASIPLQQTAYMQPRGLKAVDYSGSTGTTCATPAGFTW